MESVLTIWGWWMMTVMTAQPPLPLNPQDARPVGVAAAIVEDDAGGRVFVHGNLAYAWDGGDCAARRFAAVSLVRIKAATQLEVAEAFAVRPATVRRWEAQLAEAGVAGLLAEPKGPKRKSKLTGDTVARIHRLRAGGASYRGIATETGVSVGSVGNALVPTEDDTPHEEPCRATVSDTSLETETETEPEVPVLADPVDRGVERVLAAFGLIGSAPPVFTGCARAPLAGLLLGPAR